MNTWTEYVNNILNAIKYIALLHPSCTSVLERSARNYIQVSSDLELSLIIRHTVLSKLNQVVAVGLYEISARKSWQNSRRSI